MPFANGIWYANEDDAQAAEQFAAEEAAALAEATEAHRRQLQDRDAVRRFPGESAYDALVNHYGWDIEEEEDFRRWLSHRQVALDSPRLPEEAAQFTEARKRLSSPSQHADPGWKPDGPQLSPREIDSHPVPSWLKSGRHG